MKNNLQRRRQFIKCVVGTSAALSTPLLALGAEGYPSKPITFICPWPVGGTADLSMRTLCQIASRVLKQAITVDNKPGAAGMIGAKAIAMAKPDGYTIGQIPISVTRFSQLGMLQVDPLKDFTFIARTNGQTFGIVVLSDSKFKSLREVVEFARANPDIVSYAHAGVGGATHVAMEQFANAAGIKLNAIAYKGGSAALNDTLGGQVDILVDSGSWVPYVESGKMKLLATFGDQRTARFSSSPTVNELGYKVIVEAPNGIGAPANLPLEMESKLRNAFRFAINSDEFKAVAARIDSPVMYLDGPEYKKYVAQVYQQETQLIEKLKLKDLLAKG
jgi:tripartite-type tricarboxylate transporter receptor subunit TctC